MLVVISLFTGVIFFILYARKSRLCFSVGKKEDTDLLFLSFFRRPSSSEVFQRYELLELSLEGGNRLSMFRISFSKGNTEILRIEMERPFLNSSISVVT